ANPMTRPDSGVTHHSPNRLASQITTSPAAVARAVSCVSGGIAGYRRATTSLILWPQRPRSAAGLLCRGRRVEHGIVAAVPPGRYLVLIPGRERVLALP